MEEKTNTKDYELAYLLESEISEENLNSGVDNLKKIISENGGEVTESDTPKKRRLSYPIKKQNQAYFGVIYFKITSEDLLKIKSVLSLHKKLMRFLIIAHQDTRKTHVEPLDNIKIKDKIEQQVKLPDESINEQSFEKKLESILNG